MILNWLTGVLFPYNAALYAELEAMIEEKNKQLELRDELINLLQLKLSRLMKRKEVL